MTRLRFLLPILLGALAGTGFAPLAWWPVTLACFAGWLWLVHDARTMRAALLLGWLFGVGHFTVTGNWIQHAFTYQDAMPHWLGYLAVVLLAGYLAVYPMMAAGIAWRLASPRTLGDTATVPSPAFALVAGAAWIATEYLRAEMFTGYAWDPLGTIWLPLLGIAHLARFIGTYALSGLTVVAAGSLLLVVQRRWWMPAIVLTVAVIATVTGFDLPVTPVAPVPDAPLIRVVQPNMGEDERPEPGFEDRRFATLLALSQHPDDGRRRLVVWPEGATDYFIEDGYPLYAYWQASPFWARRRMAAVLGPRDLLLTGGGALLFDAEGDATEATNSIFAVRPDTSLGPRYDKAHLVPYGEYLPMRPILSRLGLARLVPGDMDFRPGPGPRTIRYPGFGPIGLQICYEIIFSGEVVDEAHRPNLLFNPSNDSWFGSWGPPQHLAQARMRAIEEGLPIVRATPTGISAIIAADGRLVETIALHHRGIIERAIPEPLPAPPFTWLGNWWAAFVTGALLAGAVAIRRRRR